MYMYRNVERWSKGTIIVIKVYIGTFRFDTKNAFGRKIVTFCRFKCSSSFYPDTELKIIKSKKETIKLKESLPLSTFKYVI